MPHPQNRPYQIQANDATGKFLFELYKLLFVAKVELRIKQRTFETGAESKHQWRVVSISINALNHIQQNGTAVGLRRGHVMSRFKRAQYLFERESSLEKEELLQYFFEHDTVALVTKTENSVDGSEHWSELHPVPEGMFTSGSFSIKVRQRYEIPWVTQYLITLN